MFVLNRNFYGESEDRINLSNARYEKMLALTNAIFGAQALSKVCMTESSKWANLSFVWHDACKAPTDFNVFESVIHKIHWGIYPERDYSSEQLELLSLVEEEILLKGSGNQQWLHDACYEEEVDHIVSQVDANTSEDLCCHSIEHHQFLRNRTEYELQYKISMKFRTAHNLKEAISYQIAVAQVLPEAVNWTYHQWSDDRNIIAGLQERYGFTFTDYSDNYNRLILLLKPELQKGNTYYWLILVIEELPYLLAQQIWPKNTKRTLIGMFLQIHKLVKQYETAGKPKDSDKTNHINPYGVFDMEYLKKCWLYKLVKQWYDNDTITTKKAEVKRAVFDILMS